MAAAAAAAAVRRPAGVRAPDTDAAALLPAPRPRARARIDGASERGKKRRCQALRREG